MSFFNFSFPKVPDTVDQKLGDALQPIYSIINSIYQNFVHACGVISPPRSEYDRLKRRPQDSVQPQNLNRMIVKAYEDLAFGTMIGLVMDGSTLVARKAKGGTGSWVRANGYCNTPGGVLANEDCEIIVITGLLAVTGATVGQTYYLSSTPGALSTTAATSGLNQWVGIGIAPDLVYIDCLQLTQVI